MQLAQQRLRELLDYCPETGEFTWRVYRARGARPGMKAGTFHEGTGYIAIKVGGTVYYAHRLAHLWMNGSWPSDEIDHKNLIRIDNSWANLRCATSSDNKCNRPGHGRYPKGVTFHRVSGRYAATTYKNNRRFSLGYYDTPDEAHAVYVKAAKTLHGEFSRTN